MKQILIVSVDKVTGDTASPINVARNKQDAIRSWGRAMTQVFNNNPNNVPVEDLELYQIGEFDTLTLEIVPCKEFIAKASEFCVKYKTEQPKED